MTRDRGSDVDVALDGEHIGGAEALAAGEQLPDTLVAVGVGPVIGDGEGVAGRE